MGISRWQGALFAAVTLGITLAPAPHFAVAAGAAAAGTDAAEAEAVAPAADAAGAEGVTMLGVAGRANATPWVVADGRFVAVAWGASAGEKKNDVFVAISRDGGETFAAPVQVNLEAGEGRLGGELPPRIVLLPSSSNAGAGADPDVAVLWTARSATTAIKVARSRDGGRRFEAPVSLQTPGAAGDRGWPALAADRRGTLHAIWLDHRGLAAMKAGQTHGAGGHHGGDATPAPGAAGAARNTADAAMHDSVAMAQRSGLYYASLGPASPAASARAAASASAPAPAAAAATTNLRSAAPAVPDRELTAGVCYCCKTALAVRGDGVLVAAWRQVYAGNIRDIAFTTSRDGGQTFAAPLRVSEDKWEINGCPDDGPAIAVGPDDTIHLVWPTVMMKGDEPEGALFYASTRDGRSFTPRQRVATLGSPKPMHPQLLVDRAGRITVAWDEFVDGRRVAAMRTIKPTSKPAGQPGAGADAHGGLDSGPVVTLGAGAAGDSRGPGRAPAEDAPAQYPMLAATRDGAIAVWTSGSSSASTIAVRRLPPPVYSTR